MVNFNASLQGLHNAELLFDRAAGQVARSAVPLAPEPPADAVSLSEAMVALIEARDEFQANARAFRTAEGLNRDLLDVLRSG